MQLVIYRDKSDSLHTGGTSVFADGKCAIDIFLFRMCVFRVGEADIKPKVEGPAQDLLPEVSQPKMS